MSKAELMASTSVQAKDASRLIERLIKCAESQGGRLDGFDIERLLLVRSKMQAALCAVTKLEQMARGMRDPNEEVI
jgi:hypothetical protein